MLGLGDDAARAGPAPPGGVGELLIDADRAAAAPRLDPGGEEFRRDSPGERVDRARGGVGVAGPEHGAQRVRAAEDVERQEAVVAVVAVEAAALLAAVHLVVRRVDVEHEPRWRQPSRPGLDEQFGEQRLERPGVMGDPCDTAPAYRPRVRARGGSACSCPPAPRSPCALPRACRTTAPAGDRAAGSHGR